MDFQPKISPSPYIIGSELFEDFDPETYDRFDRKLGQLAQASGYDLLKILPGKDSSLMGSIKTAILSLSELVDSVYVEQDPDSTAC